MPHAARRLHAWLIFDVGQKMKDLLEAARREAVATLSAAINPGAIGEPALRAADGSIVFDPQGLQTPLRKDVARKEGESWVTANVDARGIRVSSPLRIIWDEKLVLSIASVTWDYVTFSVAPSAAARDFGSIREWFLRWFDPDNRRVTSPEGLSGVVHFLSDPECRDGRWQLIVDFGSAPTHAFEELLDCFVALGFTDCEVR